MIYFVRPVGQTGPIKIGFSREVGKRLADLQRASPVPLELVASLAHTAGIERALHRWFSADHLHGEWFKPSPGLAAIIERHAARPPVQAALPRHHPPLCDNPTLQARSADLRVRQLLGIA